MITLLLRQENQPEVEVKVDGNIARVGRAPGSQILLTQNYVSKRHLRVLKGIVIVDLGSSNGTFLDGKRIKDPVLYTGGELRVGDGEVYLRVRMEEADEAVTAQLSNSGVGGRNGSSAEAKRKLSEAQAENERIALELGEARKRIGELEAERVQQTRPDAAPAPVEADAALDRAQREIEELRAQIAALQAAALQAAEAKPSPPLSPAAELFVKLQTENSSLKRKLAELQSKPGANSSAPAAEGMPAKLLAELVELRAQNAALRAQGGSLGARAVSAPAGQSNSNVRVLFARLAKDDVDRQTPLLVGASEEFLVIEQFRMVRQVERIVTRMAGEFIQLRDANTMLPDLQSNLRMLIARLGETSEDADARRELLEYFAQLSRWLVASLAAHRKAAEAFAQKLKTDLSEEGLTANAPIPAIKRLSGQREAELWRRTGIYLRELTPDMVEDRLEKFAREAALELIGEEGAPRQSKTE